jgi:hypothetical protein
LFTVIDEFGKTWSIPLIDFHTHIGKVPIETTKGSSHRTNRPQDILDLYEKLKFQLYSKIQSESNKYYISLPDRDDFVKPIFPIVKDSFYSELNLNGWIADQIVSFPFNDIFHTKTNPKFVKSNEYVRHSLNKFEFAFRFIPFCRVDATEDKASDEVINSASLGAKGLKLHPLSQHWIEKIISEETKNVLHTAGKLQLPIIFDVPNKGVAADITEISNQARQEKATPIEVILGHNGFDYSSPEIFEYISQKGMYTEISGMRGSDVGIFFQNIVNVSNWTDKILFGTDANYFSVLQAVDFISYLLTYEFLDLIQSDTKNIVKPLEIVSKILGLNAINLLPLNYQNRINLNLNSSETKDQKINKIILPNLIKSFKNIIQKKDLIFNISLIQFNGEINPIMHVKYNKNLYSCLLMVDKNVTNNIYLKFVDTSFKEGPNVIITPKSFSEFIENKYESKIFNSTEKDIKIITTLEELFKENNT